MNDEILIKLRELISSHLGIDNSEIQANSHLQNDFDADPLSISDLLDTVEKEFSIKFDQNQTSEIKTVEDIINIISDQIA